MAMITDCSLKLDPRLTFQPSVVQHAGDTTHVSAKKGLPDLNHQNILAACYTRFM